MFLAVEFTKELALAIINESWLVKSEGMAWWPPFSQSLATKNCVQPVLSKWKKYPIRILATSGELLSQPNI